jgi:peptidoglycan/LPS O-acetylase OafA/YrhL
MNSQSLRVDQVLASDPTLSADRATALDCLRGVAALSVVFHHCLITFPVFWAAYEGASVQSTLSVKLLAYSPLHVLWGGLEAVVVFYALSGFVLSISFFSPDPPPFRVFLAKRCCRIYIPYVVAVLLSGALLNVVPERRLNGVSTWFDQFWNQRAAWTAIKDHLLMMGTAKWNYLNPVVWSLVHEMRISLIFPLVILAVRRVRWQLLVPAILALSLGAKLFVRIVEPGGFGASLLETASYVFLFVAGAELSLHRRTLTLAYCRLSQASKLGVFALSFALLNGRWELPARWATPATPLIWIGALALVAQFAVSTQLEGIAEHSGLRWLGRTSYSLYLVHVVILFALVRSLGGRVPLPAIVATVPPVAFLVSALFFKFIELPSIALGRQLGQRLRVKALPMRAEAFSQT